MFVFCGDGMAIVNMDRYDRAEVNNQGEHWLVSAINESGHPKTLGRYIHKETALEELDRLSAFIEKGQHLYCMTENCFDIPERMIKDSRVRRRGGS